MIQVQIVGVRIEMPSNQPLVLLKESLGERHIPIWIGASEATAIALAEQGVVPPRPLTHDLLCGVVIALGHRVIRVNLTKVEDGIFYAELVFEDGTTVGSRASDAIAVAQRADCSIWAAESVIEEAGVIIADHDDDADPEDDAKERQVRQFREFLDEVEPEDFDK
ncbi:bifunctional nuclease family protein [Specibacter sp. RAF43]|uniref:bifunctional nuclease family protein n=1 Tax=Specibacter sp. RAF43 TaxID=3233057 RepID=UPI003F9C3C23